MHLNLLCDTPDVFDRRRDHRPADTAARQHLLGLIRGVVFMTAILAPVALSVAHHAIAGG